MSDFKSFLLQKMYDDFNVKANCPIQSVQMYDLKGNPIDRHNTNMVFIPYGPNRNCSFVPIDLTKKIEIPKAKPAFDYSTDDIFDHSMNEDVWRYVSKQNVHK